MPTAAYAIDIAANMPDGPKTASELDDLTAKLMGGGKGAEFFSQALAQTEKLLGDAKAAAASANASLDEGVAMFGQLEKAALKAAQAEEKAALKGAVPPEVAAEAARARAALDAYGFTLKSLEVNAAAADAEEVKLSKTLTNLKTISGHVDKSLAGQAENTEKLRGALASVPGPLGKLGSAALAPVQGFQKLSASMGESNAAMLLGAAGAATLVVAVAALTVAVIAGVVAVAAWSVSLADAGRSAGLVTEATEVLHPELEALHSTIDGLTDSTGLTENALDKIAISLKAAHVAAKDMPAALEAAANAEAALGQGGAQEFISQMQKSGKSVAAFSDEVNEKLGGVVAAKLRGLDGQADRFKKNIGRLFGSLDIEPALGGLQTLVALFDEGTSSGQAMKFLFETVFQPIIDQAQNAAYFVEAFVLGFLIGMTKLYIALKPAIKAVGEFFGFKDTSLADGLDLAKQAGELIVPVFLVFVGVIGAVVAVIGLAVAQVIAIQLAIYALIAAVVYAGVQVGKWFVETWQNAVAFFEGVSLYDIGVNMLQGLADGITAAKDRVVGAITGAVGGAVDSAKKLLGIASPSKVFAEIGGYTGEGFAQGVEDATPDAHAAMAGLVEPPDAADVPVSPLAAPSLNVPPSARKSDQIQDSGKGGGGGSSKGAGARILEGATLQFYGVKDAEHARDMFEELLTEALEGDADSIAGEAAPA
jgi:hypothetical protein